MASSDQIDSGDISALLSSTIFILIGIVFTSIAKLLERVIIARAFTPEKYGEVAIGLAIMGIGSTIALAGVNQGVPRFVSRAKSDDERRGVWAIGLTFSVLLSLVITALLFLNVEWVAKTFFEEPDSAGFLRVFILTIPAVTGFTVGIGAFRGMENTRYKFVVNDLFYPLLRLILFVLFLVGGFGLLSIGYAYLVAAIISLGAAHLLLNRLYRLVGGLEVNARELLSYSLPLVATTIIAILLTRTDTLMIGYFRTSTEVGLYNVAYPLSNSLLMVLSAFGYLYFPLTSRLDSEQRHEAIEEIYQLITKWTYIITFPAFLVFTMFSKDVIQVFFGGQYTAAGTALTILSIGFFASATVGRNRETLSALGYTKTILFVDLTTLVTNIGLNLFLIPRFGFQGAAVASSVSYIGRNLALNGVLKLKSGITPISRYTIRTYVVLPLVFLPLTVVLAPHIVLTSVTLLPFLVITGVLSIFLVFFAGGFQESDALILDFIEEKSGREIPYIRNVMSFDAKVE